MKKITQTILIFLFLLLFGIGKVCGQEIPQNPNKTDEKGLKQGKWTILYDANWNIITEANKAEFYRTLTYKDGKPIGKVTDWYKNGKPQMVADSLIQEEPPKYEGNLTFYRADGSKENVQVFKNGQMVNQTAYNPDGSIDEESLQSLYNQASTFSQQGKYIEAINILEKAIILAEKEFGKKHPTYANFCTNLASLYNKQGLYEKAEPLCTEAKNINEEVLGKKHRKYSLSCNNLAVLYQYQGLYKKAESLFIEAKNIDEQILGKKHPKYATPCNNLATLYQDQGLYEKAEPLFIEAKNIWEEALGKKDPDYAVSCGNLAGLYDDQGLYEKAEPLHIEAKNIIEEVLGKKHPYYAISCNSLAVLYHKQGLYEKAEPLYIEAKNIREEVLGKKHPEYATACGNLAVLYQDKGLYSKSELLHIEAKNIDEEILGKKHPNYANSCSNLAGLYKEQGLYSKSEPLYIEAKNIYEEILGKKHPNYANSCNALAVLYHKQGLYEKAEPLYKKSIQNKLSQIEILLSTFSEAERKQYIQSIEYFFEDFYDFSTQYDAENPSIASDLFNLRLKTKGLLFQSFQKVQQEILGSEDTALIAKYNTWKDKRSYLAKVYELSKAEKEKRGIDEAKIKAEAENLEKELSKSVSTLSKLGTLTKLEWQDVQAQLQKNEALIEMIRVQSKDSIVKYVALIITPDTQNQPEMLVLENGNDLEKKFIKYYRNAIKSKTEDNFSYPQFFAKIQEKLPENTQSLYFSPDGVYHQLSLQTLRNPEDAGYLSDKYQIQVLGSPKDLVTYANNPKAQKKKLKEYQLYLFGYPLYDAFGGTKQVGEDRSLAVIDSTQRFFSGGKVALLPGTKTEVKKITEIAQSKKIAVKVFLETEANEERLKSLKNLDILHIATHGFFLSDISQTTDAQERGFAGISNKKFRENPLLRSGLLFAGAETSFNKQLSSEQEENGILSAEEALSLNLEGTDLVVLSACETGLGEISNGEGVYGLQRAFQQAGAQTILMSLWTVSDEATQKMMTYFYENLLEKKQDKRTAFRNAQKKLREAFPHPYYWGAFVMVGE